MTYRMDKSNFVEFWVKMAKMILKVMVNDPYFQYQLRISHDSCLVQIWWFQLKSMTSYRADNVKLTDGWTVGRTDGQTQETTVPLRPEKPWGKNHKIKLRQTSMVYVSILNSLSFWHTRVIRFCGKLNIISVLKSDSSNCMTIFFFRSHILHSMVRQ